MLSVNKYYSKQSRSVYVNAFDTEKKKKENRKIERGEFITPPRPTGRRSNQSSYMGIFPEKLKIAKVIHVFKSGQQNSLKNYRPISLVRAAFQLSVFYTYVYARKRFNSSA